MTAAVRIAATLALAAYASYHWFALVGDPPLARWLGLIGVAAALAVALEVARGLHGRARSLVAALACACALVGGLLVTGLPARLLLPGGWNELGSSLQSGLTGVGEVELPYAGPNPWTRLGILLAAPLVVALSVAAAHWPGRARRPRLAGIAGLVGLYAFAVTWEAPGAELTRGLALLVLVAAYLWLPRLPPRRALAGATAVGAAGLLALPAASSLGSEEPVVDYTDWAIFGSEPEVSFDWNHSYGRFDWPQEGRTLLEIRADRPLLWRAAVLDTFDGSRWLRGGVPGAPDAPRFLAGASQELAEDNRDRGWRPIIGVEVRGLRSDLLIGAGTTLEVEGIEPAAIDEDGTAVMGEGALTTGDTYSVTSYAPDPSPAELRRAEGPYPPGLRRYTALTLPYGAQAMGLAPAPTVPVVAPLRGSRGAERRDPVGETVAATPYARVHALTRRLTRDAASTYDAVDSVEEYLRSTYRYSQQVPMRRAPLPAFLFLDRRGYCQQFSGAMALMLRMAGIPARVASGFAPGYRAPGDNVYAVRDMDAHSWVEVWFPEIGWVPFDPTPGAAPARAQSLAAVGAAGEVARFGAARALRIEETAEGRGDFTALSSESDDGPSLRGAASAALALGACVAGALAWHRRRRLLHPGGATAQLEEVVGALGRLGYSVGPRATLLRLEGQLAGAGPAVTRYVARLRANRYAEGGPRRPGPPERRALRRALAKAAPMPRVRARWRAWRAIPPGGPRRR